MNALDRASFLAHSRTAPYDRKVEQAHNVVRQWLGLCQAPYASYSAGKDSTVTLAVAREHGDIPAIYADDEWTLPETEEHLRTVDNLLRFKSRDQHASWLTSWANDPDAWEGGAPAYARAHGYDGAAIGLRMEENRRRRFQAGKNREPFFSEKNGVWQCYPLAAWSWKDVWAYILANDLSYNLAYDRLAELGVGYDHSRVGPFAVELDGPHDPLHQGQLAILKQGWPELYERFAEAHPEARYYV